MLEAKVLDSIKRQNTWLRSLCDVEEKALSMCVPVDLANMEPELIECRKGDDLKVFNYWRVMLSSEPQRLRVTRGGRNALFLVRDKKTGGFLGVFALTSLFGGCEPVYELFDWKINGEGEQSRQHQLLLLRRCLPLYEFGQMTGGKFLALVASSQEAVRIMELRFSFQFAYLSVRSMHGKGSQYNRLNQRGLDYLGLGPTGSGYYGMELRKGGIEYMRSGAPYGATKMHKLKDQIAYWEERWLKARLESTQKPSIITPDRETYRLSRQYQDRCLLPSMFASKEDFKQ
jgi:hypothetical protein